MKHRKRFSNFTFKISEKIGSGCFGEVYSGKCLQTGDEVAIKKEYIGVHSPQLFSEMKIIRTLNNSVGFPSFFGYWPDEGYNALAETLLGKNLIQLFRLCNHKFTIKTVFMLADQMISRLEFLHNKDIIHRDIKPENFLIGKGKNQNVIYLADFGLSKFYRDSISHIHIPYREGRPLVGTARYVSLNIHFGIEASRRDDLESLAYLLIYFAKGRLPWQGFKSNDKIAKRRYIFEKKQTTSIDSLCEGLPPEFAIFLESTRKLDFEETPYYTNYKNLFRSALIRMGECCDYKFCWLPPISETSLIKNGDQISTQNSTHIYPNHSQIFNPSTTHLHCLMAENHYLPHNRLFPRSMDRLNFTHRISLNAKSNNISPDKSPNSVMNSNTNIITPNGKHSEFDSQINKDNSKSQSEFASNPNSISTLKNDSNGAFIRKSSSTFNSNKIFIIDGPKNSTQNSSQIQNNTNINSNANASNNGNSFIRKSSSTFNSNTVLFINDSKKEFNNNSSNQKSSATCCNVSSSSNSIISNNNDTNENDNKNALIRKSSSACNSSNILFSIDNSSNQNISNAAGSAFNVSSSSNSNISNNANKNDINKSISTTTTTNDSASNSKMNNPNDFIPNNSKNKTLIRKCKSDLSDFNGNILIRKSCSDFNDDNLFINKSNSDFSEIKFDNSNPNLVCDDCKCEHCNTNSNSNFNNSNSSNNNGDEIDINSYTNYNIFSGKTHKNLSESLFARYNKFNSSVVIHRGSPALVKPNLFAQNCTNNADSSNSISINAAEDSNQKQKIDSVQQQQHQQLQQEPLQQLHHNQQYETQQRVKKSENIRQTQSHHTHHHHHHHRHATDDYIQQFELLHVKKPHPSLWSPNILLSKHLI